MSEIESLRVEVQELKARVEKLESSAEASAHRIARRIAAALAEHPIAVVG